MIRVKMYFLLLTAYFLLRNILMPLSVNASNLSLIFLNRNTLIGIHGAGASLLTFSHNFLFGSAKLTLM